MKKMRMGIVGCGAIGSSLAQFIKGSLKKDASLVALYDIDTEKARTLSRLVFKNDLVRVKSLGQLIARSDLVIEAASSHASWYVARSALIKGKNVLVMSVGGIVDKYAALSALARKNNAKVYCPSGAISGVDALKAARIGKIRKVVLTTRKHPLSFRGVKYVEGLGIKLDKIKKDKVLFFGPAEKAVKNFPQNINVAAVLSIAGIGKHKTLVKIIASGRTKKNIHEIEIDAAAARISCRTENVLHPKNPKTSYLAVLSAAAVLKGILEPVRVGT